MTMVISRLDESSGFKGKYIEPSDLESTIMLSGSSQGESSVLGVRLTIVKSPLQIRTIDHYKYALAEANTH